MKEFTEGNLPFGTSFVQNNEAYHRKVKQEFKGNNPHHPDDTPASTRQQVCIGITVTTIIYPRYNTDSNWLIKFLLKKKQRNSYLAFVGVSSLRRSVSGEKQKLPGI